MANNRICLTCGKPYEYCGSCPSSLNLPVWKNIFDTENCKTVFETVSKESAKVRLSKCDVSGVFKSNIQNLVDEINKENVKITETKENEIKAKYGNKKKSVSVMND